MIYRAAQLEEIVGDLMDMVEQERERGQKVGAEVALVRLENRNLRKALCSILTATQTLEVTQESKAMMQEIEDLVERALSSEAVISRKDLA
jgi:regulator of replication initiation timing